MSCRFKFKTLWSIVATLNFDCCNTTSRQRGVYIFITFSFEDSQHDKETSVKRLHSVGHWNKFKAKMEPIHWATLTVLGCSIDYQGSSKLDSLLMCIIWWLLPLFDVEIVIGVRAVWLRLITAQGNVWEQHNNGAEALFGRGRTRTQRRFQTHVTGPFHSRKSPYVRVRVCFRLPSMHSNIPNLS